MRPHLPPCSCSAHRVLECAQFLLITTSVIHWFYFGSFEQPVTPQTGGLQVRQGAPGAERSRGQAGITWDQRVPEAGLGPPAGWLRSRGGGGAGLGEGPGPESRGRWRLGANSCRGPAHLGSQRPD